MPPARPRWAPGVAGGYRPDAGGTVSGTTARPRQGASARARTGRDRRARGGLRACRGPRRRGRLRRRRVARRARLPRTPVPLRGEQPARGRLGRRHGGRAGALRRRGRVADPERCTAPRARRSPQRHRHHARRDRAGRRARRRAPVRSCRSRRIRRLRRGVRVGAVHDPDARRRGGLACRPRIVPQGRAVDSRADGRRASSGLPSRRRRCVAATATASSSAGR